MRNFDEVMLKYENSLKDQAYITKIGTSCVVITAAHTMMQELMDDTIKMPEIFTKAISMYVGLETESSYLIKNKDNGVDSNHSDSDTFKSMLLDIIRDHKIDLILDIHGVQKRSTL